MGLGHAGELDARLQRGVVEADIDARLAHLSADDCIIDPLLFFFSSRRRHTRFDCGWSSDVCSSDLPRLTDAALRALCSCAWRGNVRELQNVIEHVAVVVEPGADIRPEDLHLTGDPTPEVTGANPASLISTLLEESYHAARDRVIAQFERQYLTWLVNRASGNMSKAARIAGVDRTTLYRLMERHGLQRSPTAGWVVEREPEPAAGAMDEAQVSIPVGAPGGEAA